MDYTLNLQAPWAEVKELIKEVNSLALRCYNH